MKIESLKIVTPKKNETAILYAKKLLSGCESGEYTQVICIGFRPDGGYTISQSDLTNVNEKIGLFFQLIMELRDSVKEY